MMRGVLIGPHVIVPDISSARKLFSEGFYGKPLGIPKPKSFEFDAPLVLSIIEALYLVEKGVLEVVDTSGRKLSPEELREVGRSHNPRFDLLYTVYRDLRDRGFVVKSGLKFGCDYAVYVYGPGIDHAPFLVHVMRADEEIDPVEIVRAGRLSHSVRKSFIIAAVEPDGRVKYIMFKWFKP